MAVVTSALLGFGLLVVALLLGREIGMRLDNEIALIANASQAVGGVVWILVFSAFLFFDGWLRLVGVIGVLAGAAMATKRGSDTRANLRSIING
jgi:hypothetical protein